MSWVKRAFPVQFVHVCYEFYRAAFSEKNRHVAFRHAVKYFLPAVYPLRIKIGARILVSRLVSSKTYRLNQRGRSSVNFLATLLMFVSG